MSGVIVLESYIKPQSTALGVFAIVWAVLLFAALISLLVITIIDREWVFLAFVPMAVLVVGIWITISVDCFAPTHYEKVKVDPSANYWEFNQRYEVVEQEGDIYTVMLREDNDDGE